MAKWQKIFLSLNLFQFSRSRLHQLIELERRYVHLLAHESLRLVPQTIPDGPVVGQRDHHVRRNEDGAQTVSASFVFRIDSGMARLSESSVSNSFWRRRSASSWPFSANEPSCDWISATSEIGSLAAITPALDERNGLEVVFFRFIAGEAGGGGGAGTLAPELLTLIFTTGANEISTIAR